MDLWSPMPTLPIAHFCSDHRIAALDGRSYWTRTGETERLYDLGSRSTPDVSAERPAERDSLKRSAESMVQAAARMAEERMAGPRNAVDPRRP